MGLDWQIWDRKDTQIEDQLASQSDVHLYKPQGLHQQVDKSFFQIRKELEEPLYREVLGGKSRQYEANLGGLIQKIRWLLATACHPPPRLAEG